MQRQRKGILMADQARGPEALSQFSKIKLWGAGFYVESVIACFEKDKILAIYDNNPEKWGHHIQGIPICSPEEFSIDDDTAVIISASKHISAIAKELHEDLHVSPRQLFPLVISPMLNHHYLPDMICAHQNELEQAMELLADHESKEYFSSYVNAVLTMNPLLLMHNSCITGAYIYQSRTETISPKSGDCIVDCGAFIGDTMERFIQLASNQCKFYGLEPVLGNFKALVQTAQKYQSIQPVSCQCAVGKELGTAEIISTTEMTVCADILGTYADKKDAVKQVVPMETLDHLFKTEKIDYIKMDIEGAEFDALLGAQNIIKRDNPSMMISAYHMINHIWEIPHLIHDIEPSYRIYCGHQPYVPFEPEFYCSAR